MNTLKGIFDNQKPAKKNFILENVRHIRTMRKVSDRVVNVDPQPKKANNYPHVTAKVSTHLNAALLPKGGSATEVTGQRNSYSNRSSVNSGMASVRSRPQLLSSKPQYLIKLSAPRKSQGVVGPISNNFQNNEIYGQSNSKICDMMTNVPSISHISRSTSVLSGSSQRPVVGGRLRSSVSENQVCTKPVRSLGCQTIPSGDMDRILNEGVIKYPSTWSIEVAPNEQKYQPRSKRPTTCDSALQTEFPADRTIEPMNPVSKPSFPRRMLPPNDEVSSCRRLQNIFHSNNDKILNEDQIDEKLKVVVGHHKNFSQGHWYGGLNRAKKRPDSGEPQVFPGFEDEVSGDSQCCPEGHIPLSDVERTETLRMLRKNYEEHIKELNSLPVRTDTLKMRQRKIDLERQLNKLEEGIKIFSRPKVFVKLET